MGKWVRSSRVRKCHEGALSGGKGHGGSVLMTGQIYEQLRCDAESGVPETQN